MYIYFEVLKKLICMLFVISINLTQNVRAQYENILMYLEINKSMT